MAEEIQMILQCRGGGKWMQMLLYFQNSTCPAHRIVFANEKQAGYARGKLKDALYRRSEWFDLFVTTRGTDVYVIKLSQTRKVVIRDGK